MEENNVGANVVLWIVDACFWMDIILNFRTAIMDPNANNLTQMHLISDWKVITWSYLKGWFVMDVVGSFPMQVYAAHIDLQAYFPRAQDTVCHASVGLRIRSPQSMI